MNQYNLHERRLRGSISLTNLHEPHLRSDQSMQNHNEIAVLAARARKHPQHNGLQVESYRRGVKNTSIRTVPATLLKKIAGWLRKG